MTPLSRYKVEWNVGAYLNNGGLAPVFVYSLVLVLACIADITSLALVTLEMVDDFLFVYKGRFLFHRFQIMV